MRTLLIIATTLLGAGGAGYYWLLQQQERARMEAEAREVVTPAPVAREVIVAGQDLHPGSILRPEHLERKPLDDGAVTPEMVQAGSDGEAWLVGGVARRTLPAGQPIVRADVVQPGERGFLAAVLPKGKRAISIPITEVAGLSGLVLPGDRVDIILTYSVAGATIAAGRDVRASETVMSNIRVLALDQRLHQERAGEGVLSEGTPIARTATLQVSPRQAEMMTLATTLGELSLVLNSVHDGGESEERRADKETAEFIRIMGAATRPRSMTLDSDVSSLLRGAASGEPEAAPAVPEIERRRLIQIVRGATSGDVELGGGETPPPATSPPAEAPPGDAVAAETELGLDDGERVE